MRLPRPLFRTLLLCSLSLAATASLAGAAHVPGVLPLVSSNNHTNEKFLPSVFPVGNYSFYDFSGADLTNCTFSPGTNLTGARFRGAKLTNANFNGCILDQASFLGADLTFAFLPCMGGAEFRGAILTGVTGGGNGCAACVTPGFNATDACTVNPFVNLCLGNISFRALASGVVFDDANNNGVLDFGEQGVPNANVNVFVSPFTGGQPTDPRGGYFVVIPNGGTGSVQVTLPSGYSLAGPASQSLNLGNCRSSQGINFPAHSAATPAQRSTFGRVKALYR